VLAAVVFLAVTFAPTASALPPRYYQFENSVSHKCMSAEGGRMVNGTKVIQWTCYSARDQEWYVDGYAIRNKKDPSFCLSSPNNWTSPGVQLIIWKCQNAPGQNWVTRFAGGKVVFQNRYSDRVVAVGGGSGANGAAVIQWQVSEAKDQVWIARLYEGV
jgi:hypothetical protein